MRLLFSFISIFTYNSFGQNKYKHTRKDFFMKSFVFKIIALVLPFALFLSIAVSVSASESHTWYIKRNGQLRPSFPSDCDQIRSHNGYFIDESVGDDSVRRVLYITFDAGYENGNIEKILDTLRDESVPAAFFLLDNIILKNTDLVKRMAKEGHLVCNHTKKHKDLSSASEEEIAKDLSALEELYSECTGNEMAKYFRFPEGKYSIDAIKTVEKLGYKTVFWSFGYDDWDNTRQPSKERAIKKILDNTHNGAVILLHPTSKTNAEILPYLISAWRSMGYTFGTLDELCSK